MEIFMMLYNNTSKIAPHYSLYGEGDIEGVILPRSDKVLLEADIDTRIAKAKSEIDHWKNRLAHRVTHGGKRFRARQISIKDQRELCTARLKELESAKAIFVNQRIRYGANQEKIRSFVETTTLIAIIASKSFFNNDSPIINVGKIYHVSSDAIKRLGDKQLALINFPYFSSIASQFNFKPTLIDLLIEQDKIVNKPKFESAVSYHDDDLYGATEVELEVEIDQQFEIDQKDFQNDSFVSADANDDDLYL